MFCNQSLEEIFSSYFSLNTKVYTRASNIDTISYRNIKFFVFSYRDIEIFVRRIISCFLIIDREVIPFKVYYPRISLCGEVLGYVYFFSLIESIVAYLES
jgi:hypothetical protein